MLGRMTTFLQQQWHLKLKEDMKQQMNTMRVSYASHSQRAMPKQDSKVVCCAVNKHQHK